MRRYSSASFLVAIALSVALIGCGGDSQDQAAEPTTAQPETTTTPEATATAAMQAFSDDGNVAEITIEGNDMMQFDLDEFSVEPGQMVRITLHHVGTLPAQAMGHNVVILYEGDDVMEFGADVGMEGGNLANDYVPESLLDRVLAYTELIGGGETTTVEFQAPQDAGDYPFLCSFPGHFAQMNGIMKVE